MGGARRRHAGSVAELLASRTAAAGTTGAAGTTAAGTTAAGTTGAATACATRLDAARATGAAGAATARATRLDSARATGAAVTREAASPRGARGPARTSVLASDAAEGQPVRHAGLAERIAHVAVRARALLAFEADRINGASRRRDPRGTDPEHSDEQSTQVNLRPSQPPRYPLCTWAQPLGWSPRAY